MTEVLLQKVEEKTLFVLAEMEKLRRDLQTLRQENAALIAEKERSANKLQNLVSLLDSMNLIERMPVNNVAVMDAVLLQG